MSSVNNHTAHQFYSTPTGNGSGAAASPSSDRPYFTPNGVTHIGSGGALGASDGSSAYAVSVGGNSGSGSAAAAVVPDFVTMFFHQKRVQTDNELIPLAAKLKNVNLEKDAVAAEKSRVGQQLEAQTKELEALKKQYVEQQKQFREKQSQYSASEQRLNKENEALLNDFQAWLGKSAPAVRDTKASLQKNVGNILLADQAALNNAKLALEVAAAQIKQKEELLKKTQADFDAVKAKRWHVEKQNDDVFFQRGAKVLVWEACVAAPYVLNHTTKTATIGQVEIAVKMLQGLQEELKKAIALFDTDNQELVDLHTQTIELQKRSIANLTKKGASASGLAQFQTTLRTHEQALQALTNHKAVLNKQQAEVDTAIKSLAAALLNLQNQAKSKAQEEAKQSKEKAAGAKRKAPNSSAAASSSSSSAANVGNASNAKRPLRVQAEKESAKKRRIEQLERAKSPDGDGDGEDPEAGEIAAKKTHERRIYSANDSGCDSDANEDAVTKAQFAGIEFPTEVPVPPFVEGSIHQYIQNNPNLTPAQFGAFINKLGNDKAIRCNQIDQRWSVEMVLARYASFETFEHFITTYKPTLKLIKGNKYLLSTADHGGFHLFHLIASNPNFNSQQTHPKLVKILNMYTNLDGKGTQHILDICANHLKTNALHIAVKLRHEWIMQAFIDAGASLFATDEDGNTPLHLAVIERLGNDDEEDQCALVNRLMQYKVMNLGGRIEPNGAGLTPSQIVEGAASNVFSRSGTKKTILPKPAINWRRLLKNSLEQLAKNPENLRLK